MIKVFISSPYTKGDTAENVRVQLDAFKFLLSEGFMPFAPLLLHFYAITYPILYNECMDYCFEWIESCDYLLRLDGESKGADLEVAKAREKGIPVFYSFQELLKEKPNLRKKI
jgi:hypothetical protein